MIPKEFFKKAIIDLLKRSGFTKNGLPWYFHGPDNIVVVNFQRSSWGAEYYINNGIWLNVLGKVDRPKFYLCHINDRAEILFPEFRDLIVTACSLEHGNEEVLQAFLEFLDNVYIPFLKECGTRKKLEDLIAKGRFTYVYMRPGIKENLSMNME